MPFLEAVGRYPEGSGPEETDRRASRPREPAARAGGRFALPPRLHLQRLLHRRARQHVSALAALALVGMIALLIPLRTLRISVDGNMMTVRSRNIESRSVVDQAGISLRAGDSVDRSGNLITVQRATNVVLNVDGKTYMVRAQAETIAELLDRARVSLRQDDGVVRNGAFASPSDQLATSSEQTQTITIRRAVTFAVVENGQQLNLRSSRQTVAAALRDLGVRLGAGDEVQPPLDTELSAGLEVRVDHARPLVVTLPDGKSTIYSVAPTVGEALAGSGIPLPAGYRLDPPAETIVSAGLAVHVIGITDQQDLETERIQSYVVYQPDPSLPPGTQRVASGQDGVHYRRYDVVSEDGAQVSRELASEWDDPPASNTIIYYSTATIPAPPPATVPAPVAAQESSAEWRDLVCSYDWDCDWAMAVIMCESGGNPDAYSPAGYVGLFQIWEGYGANLRDPATNIAAAYSLYLVGGRGNWPSCP